MTLRSLSKKLNTQRIRQKSSKNFLNCSSKMFLNCSSETFLNRSSKCLSVVLQICFSTVPQKCFWTVPQKYFLTIPQKCFSTILQKCFLSHPQKCFSTVPQNIQKSLTCSWLFLIEKQLQLITIICILWLVVDYCHYKTSSCLSINELKNRKLHGWPAERSIYHFSQRSPT